MTNGVNNGKDSVGMQGKLPPRIGRNGKPLRPGRFWHFNENVAVIFTRFVDVFYIKPIRKAVTREMFRYLFCGGINMLIGWAMYYFIFHFVVRNYYLDIMGIVVMSPHIQSLFIQFPFTFAIGFWLNKYVAFDYSPLKGKVQLTRYFATVGVSLGIKYALLKLLVEVFGIFPTVSNVLADLINAVCSYLMQKYYTFRGKS